MIPTLTSDLSALLSRGNRLADLRGATLAAERELLTGRIADPGSLGPGAAGRVQRIGAEIARLEADGQSLAILDARAARIEAGLARSAEDIAALSADLIASGFRPEATVDRARSAHLALDAMLATAREAGATEAIEVDILLASMRAHLTTGGDPAAELAAYLQPGGGFDTAFPPTFTLPAILSTGERPGAPPSLLSPDGRQAILALAALALAADDPVQAASLTAAAQPLLLDAQDAVTRLRAGTGAHQAGVEDLRTVAAHRITALGLERNTLDGVDPYEAATRLQAHQDQLDTLLLITRRMSDLSLARYM